MLDLLGELLFRNANAISVLKIEPEPRACVKPMTEPYCCVVGDPSLALNDLRNAVDWHLKLTCEFRRRDAEFRQLVRKDLRRGE